MWWWLIKIVSRAGDPEPVVQESVVPEPVVEQEDSEESLSKLFGPSDHSNADFVDNGIGENVGEVDPSVWKGFWGGLD
jgi:hypothetical protein